MLGLGPGSAGGQSSGKTAPKDAYAASLQAEADDLAAITGDIGGGDDWAAQASQYAALQAQILRDMHAREAVVADEYAEQDPELARLLGLGLDLGDDETANDDAGLGLGSLGIFPSTGAKSSAAGKAAAAAPAPAAATKAAPATAPTSTVMSAADLEAQLMGMDVPSAPAPAAAPSAPSKGVPKLLSVEDMSPVPFPPGWAVGMPLPAGTFLIFDDEEEAPAPAPAPAAPANSALLTPSTAPLPQGYPAAQQGAPGHGHGQGQGVPPMGYPQGMMPQGQYPPYAGPMGPMAGSGMAPPPGLLHPQALQAMQYQYHQLVQAIQARPGQPIPPQIQEQLHFLQVSLQRHMMAMQHLNALHSQQVAAQAGAGAGMPMPRPPMPGPVPGPTTAAQQAQQGRQGQAPGMSFAQAAGGQQGNATGEAGVTILQRERPQAPPQPTAGAIGVKTQPPLPPGAAPPLPPGAPPAAAPSKPQPVTMATLLTSKVPPPRALQGKSRMSIGDILTVCRSMFNQLAALDPFTECYYALVLQTKKAAAAAAEAESARRFAMGLPPLPTTGAAGTGGTGQQAGNGRVNILDVAATLTEIGDRAISASGPSTSKGGEKEKGEGGGKKKEGGKGGRGGKQGGNNSKGGKGDKEGQTEAAPEASPAPAPGPQSDGTEGEPQLSAAAALIAALPVQTVTMRNLRANQLDLKKLHAVKRRLWEQHNSVLGRQESINIRAPKRTLNLSDTGTTTADELRAGEEHLSAARAVAAKTEGGSGESGSTGVEAASPEAATPAAQLWAVRARIDAAHEGILALQEAARKHQAVLRAHPPPPKDVVQGGRAEVNYRRANLAEIVGFTLVAEDTASAGTSLGGYTVDDAVLSAMITLPKGKRVLSRLVPMLEPGARVAAVAACMRLLPYCVASATAGADYEAADAVLSSALSGWVSSVSPPPPSAKGGMTLLAMITAWVDALRSAHSGAIIKALLQHPGASDVIATLLQRGTSQVAVIEGGKPEEAQAQAADLTAWKDSTEALGKAFVEAA